MMVLAILPNCVDGHQHSGFPDSIVFAIIDLKATMIATTETKV